MSHGRYAGLDHGGFLDVEDCGLLYRRAQGANDALDKPATPEVFLGWRTLRISEGVVELSAAHDAVGSHASRDGEQTGRQHGWNADAFTLFGNRSTATRTGASRRR